LAISDASREEMLNAIKTGDADFVICSPPLADEPNNGIITEVVFYEQCCTMLPPNHPLLSRRVLGFDDLVGEPLVTASKESGLRINLDLLMEKHNYHPQIVCESNDINLIIRVVKSGLGFAILPRSVAFSIPSIRKYCVESSLADTIGDIGLSYSPVKSDMRETSQFVDFVKRFTKDYNEKYYSKPIYDFKD